jgi:hypothetical protein
MGSVVLTNGASGSVTVAVSLVSPLEFVNTGLHDTIDFNLSGSPTITLVSTSNSNFALTSTTAGSLHFDGFGNFQYSMQLKTAQGAGGAQPSPETFVLSATGLTEASFVSNGGSNNAIFGVDVYNTVNGNTGPIGNTGSTVTTPLPASLGLLWPVLGGGYLAMRRRRKKKDAPASA